MNSLIFLSFLLAVSAGSDVSPCGWTVKEHQAVATIKALETRKLEEFDAINVQHIQHNLDLADGKAGVLTHVASPYSPKGVHTVRVFQDGDWAFTHANYTAFNGANGVGMDVWRFEDGLMVEHWDNLQLDPNVPNPGGHTMLDGPTEIKDLDKTEYNKALVTAYSNSIITPPWQSHLIADDYIQHNPLLGDGLVGLINGLTELALNGQAITYTSIFKVIGKGNYVLALALGTFGKDPVAFYDLYRVDNGKIVEHWDTIQTVPPQSQWKNHNGKFSRDEVQPSPVK